MPNRVGGHAGVRGRTTMGVAAALVLIGAAAPPAGSDYVAGAAQPLPSYSVTVLQNPPGATPRLPPTVTGISNDGDIFGYAVFYPASSTEPRYDAVIWHDGVPTDVAAEVQGGQIIGDNSSGQLVGNCTDDSGTFTVDRGRYPGPRWSWLWPTE